MGDYCVYKHTSPSGKVYIGITGRARPEIRWSKGAGYTSNIHFYNAIKKYGWDSFVHEILLSGLSQDEACKKEIELIGFYKSHLREHGYNVGLGGSLQSNESLAKRANAVKLTWADKETKERWSRAIQESMSSPEYYEMRSTISKRMWADPNKRARIIRSIKAAHNTPEMKAANSARSKQMWADPAYREKRAHAFRVLEENGEFVAKRALSAKMMSANKVIVDKRRKTLITTINTPEHKLIMSANMKRRMSNPEVKKKTLQTLADYSRTPENRARVSEFSKKLWSCKETRPKQSRAVRCIDTSTVYESAKIAAEATGGNKRGIYACCNKLKFHHTAAGLRWEWFDGEGE